MLSCMQAFSDQFRSRHPVLAHVVSVLAVELPHAILLLDVATDVALSMTLFKRGLTLLAVLSTAFMALQYPVIGWAKSGSWKEMWWRPFQVIYFDLKTSLYGLCNALRVAVTAPCSASVYTSLDDGLRIAVLGDEKHATFSLVSQPLYVNPVEQQSEIREMDRRNKAMAWTFFRGAIELIMESFPQLLLQVWMFFNVRGVVSQRQLGVAFAASAFSIAWNGTKVYVFKRRGGFGWAKLVRFLWCQDTRLPLVGAHNGVVSELTIDKMEDGDRRYLPNLCSLLSRTPALRVLNVMSSDIGDAGAAMLAGALAGHPGIEVLDVQGNQIGDGGAGQLARLLRDCRSLSALDVSWNRITAGGFLRIADALSAERGAPLAVLNAAGNALGAEGAGMLAWALRHNGRLREVNLRRNDVGDEGAAKLADAIAASPSLRAVDLRQNGIGDAGAASLGQAIERSEGFLAADLRGNEVSEAVRKELTRKIKLY
ncbi:unnamed protein product [Ostreobium quekettii]|uniref:Uncharacterized protein n=1 Tax=Ostreobium quekettii TaxID=121088 RepID=A0A8S1J3X1_9CHLO|nr:unnamed protein product [Ostreobium quekettii]